MSSELTPAEHQQQPSPEPWAASFWDSRFLFVAGLSILLMVISVVLIPYLGLAGLLLAVLSVFGCLGALIGTLVSMMGAPGAPVAEDAASPSHSHERMHQ